jgi:hypothetical protein
MWKYFRIPKLYENELSKGENVQEKGRRGNMPGNGSRRGNRGKIEKSTQKECIRSKMWMEGVNRFQTRMSE